MRIFRRISVVIAAVGMLAFPTQRSGAQIAQLVVPAIPNGAAIAAGNLHTMVLKTDGTLWTFGDNSHGQLGFATNSGTAKSEPGADADHVKRGVDRGWLLPQPGVKN